MAETQENKNVNKFWTIWNIVEDVILLAAGVLAIVIGCIGGDDTDNLRNVIQNIITYAIASFIILDGMLRLIMTLLKIKKAGEESIMLVSGFEITLGIVMMIVLKDILVEAMVYFIAIGAIVIGAMFLAFSIVTIIRKMADKYMMPILEIFFGAILIGVGLYIIILYNVNADAKNRICLILTGSVLSIVAVALAIITLVSCKKRKGKAIVPVEKEKEKGSKKKKKEEKAEQPVSEEPKPETSEEPKAIEEKKIIEAEVKEIEHKPEEDIPSEETK